MGSRWVSYLYRCPHLFPQDQRLTLATGKGHDPVEILPAEDGSGVGAALIAALTLKRVHEGKVMGIRDAKAMLAGTGPAKS